LGRRAGKWPFLRLPEAHARFTLDSFDRRSPKAAGDHNRRPPSTNEVRRPRKKDDPTMTMDKSLRTRRGLVRSRSVLTRAERLAQLKEGERWRDGDSVFGLPKVRVFKLAMKKKKKKKEEEGAEGAAAGEGAAAPAAPAAEAKKPEGKKADSKKK
jgi:small basic protein (TIGR04137 family)